MTVSLLAGSSTVPSTKINICNITEFLSYIKEYNIYYYILYNIIFFIIFFIPQSARSKYLNIGPCY